MRPTDPCELLRCVRVSEGLKYLLIKKCQASACRFNYTPKETDAVVRRACARSLSRSLIIVLIHEHSRRMRQSFCTESSPRDEILCMHPSKWVCNIILINMGRACADAASCATPLFRARRNHILRALFPTCLAHSRRHRLPLNTRAHVFALLRVPRTMGPD